jgi:hypothetical protein
VADIEKLLTKLKATGVPVISKDAALVPWSDTIRRVREGPERAQHRGGGQHRGAHRELSWPVSARACGR